MATNNKVMKRRNTSKVTNNRKFSWKSFFKNLFLLGIVGLVIGLISMGGLYLYITSNSLNISDNNFWKNKGSAFVYDRNNDLMGTLSLSNIQWVDLKDEEGNYNISEYYLKALVATEDRRFYSHNGIDIKGMGRAVTGVLTNQDTSSGGGSSISMQLAKLLYLSQTDLFDSSFNKIAVYNVQWSSPITYKLTQMVLGSKIEEKYSKDEILENYVNSMYFGAGGYGIKNASLYFYNKDPKDLTIDQAAVLAGMTQLPAVHNPYVNPEETLERRNEVIYNLVETELITEQEAKDAQALPIDNGLVDHTSEESKSDAQKQISYKSFMDAVYTELMTEFGYDFDLSDGMIDIYTTMDPDIQDGIQDVIKTDKYIDFPEKIQAGVVVMDPQNGEVLGIGNGVEDHDSFQGTNYATNYTRQPGSTIKPVLDYSAAIEFMDWSSQHELDDKAISYTGGSEVFNYDKVYKGKLTMMEALASSTNTTALSTFKQVNEKIGMYEYSKYFCSFGITDCVDVNEAYSLGGFSKGTTPLEMAGAYSVFANGGTYYEPHFVRYVNFGESSSYSQDYGETYEFEVESHNVMKTSTAYIITKMLEPSAPMAITGRANVPGMGLSIKSGTSTLGVNNLGLDESVDQDRWMVGYNANVTTATWLAYPSDVISTDYYFSTFDYSSSDFFNSIMTVVSGVGADYLYDDSTIVPSNVITKRVKNRVWPPVEDPNGVVHYFISGSKEDQLDTKAAIKKEFESQPVVTAKLENDMITFSWTFTTTQTDVKYILSIDDKEITTTKANSVQISTADLVAASCSDAYTISVKAQSGEYTSPAGTVNVTNNNGCPVEPEPDPDPTSETEDPETDEAPETDGSE